MATGTPLELEGQPKSTADLATPPQGPALEEAALADATSGA